MLNLHTLPERNINILLEFLTRKKAQPRKTSMQSFPCVWEQALRDSD